MCDVFPHGRSKRVRASANAVAELRDGDWRVVDDDDDAASDKRKQGSKQEEADATDSQACKSAVGTAEHVAEDGGDDDGGDGGEGGEGGGGDDDRLEGTAAYMSPGRRNREVPWRIEEAG